jgi:hypothetical protein
MFEKMFEKKFAKKVRKYYKLSEGGRDFFEFVLHYLIDLLVNPV